MNILRLREVLTDGDLKSNPDKNVASLRSVKLMEVFPVVLQYFVTRGSEPAPASMEISELPTCLDHVESVKALLDKVSQSREEEDVDSHVLKLATWSIGQVSSSSPSLLCFRFGFSFSFWCGVLCIMCGSLVICVCGTPWSVCQAKKRG